MKGSVRSYVVSEEEFSYAVLRIQPMNKAPKELSREGIAETTAGSWRRTVKYYFVLHAQYPPGVNEAAPHTDYRELCGVKGICVPFSNG